jgi:glycerol dehydrogenase-like iron-containing ADH family enzyme
MMLAESVEIQRPTIVLENAENFLATNKFDLYVVNPFSVRFIPDGANSLLLTRSNYSDLEKLRRSIPNDSGKILAFGAGSVFDPAKYIAKVTNSHLTIIPTALSVNSFATHRSSFFDGHSKKSFETAPANTIVLDYPLLKGAGVLNFLGVVELAATATAQADWLSAIEKELEPANQAIHQRTTFLIENTINLIDDAENTPVNLEKLFENLLESGLITQAFGYGRPVSGSEHIISSYIENEIPCAHGAALYFGILTAAMLQKKLSKDTPYVREVVDRLKSAKILRDYVRKTFHQHDVQPIIASARPRDGRYTVLDEASPKELQEAAAEICGIVFS